MSTKNERLPFKLLTNEWDKVKCKAHPRRSWLAQVELLKKELGLEDQVLDIKIIKKALEQKESGRSLKWPYKIIPNYEFIGN